MGRRKSEERRGKGLGACIRKGERHIQTCTHTYTCTCPMQMFLDQVAQFIIKNTQGAQLGGGPSVAADPFTGIT